MHEGQTLSRADAESLVGRIHAADHALDLPAFLALLDPHVRLRLGSQPPLEGTESVRLAIAGLFSQLTGIRHRLLDLSVQGTTITFEAEITYTVKDGRTVTLPYVDVLRVGGDGLITDYRIYIDLAPLFALLVH